MKVKRYLLPILLLLLVVFYGVLYKIYIPRVNAFGCFDDCFNFMGGYFLLHGKRLFSEIFYNHNPLMAYVSFLVQYFSHPQSLYELVLRHRQFLLLFSFAFGVLLTVRFRLKAFMFIIMYELTKFYLFGDRFLAEAFVIYPLVYLLGLAWDKFNKIKLNKTDYILAAIFSWFIIFAREPVVPAVLLLFGFIIYSKKWKKNLLLPVSIFTVLSIGTLLLHNIPEFFFNVVTTNSGISFAAETQGILGIGIIKIFLYPILLFFGGVWGEFRIVITALSALFICSSAFLVWKKMTKHVLFLWIHLGLLNIRYVEPGKVFYGAFHLLCWYGVFVFSTALMIATIYKKSKQAGLVLGLLFISILVFHIVSPSSFLHDKVDTQTEFINNFGIPLQVGNVVNSLSNPNDTLFLDGTDDIIMWVAKRYSSYKYSWYTSVMPNFKKYTDARTEMFVKNPPDFYYGTCIGDKDPVRTLPPGDAYIRLYNDDKPSCLWVRDTKIRSITDEQWKKAAANHFFLRQEKVENKIVKDI